MIFEKAEQYLKLNLPFVLFANPDVFTKNNIKDSVYEALTSYESRIDVIEILPTFSDDGIYLQIKYRIKNTNIISSITTTVKRTA